MLLGDFSYELLVQHNFHKWLDKIMGLSWLAVTAKDIDSVLERNTHAQNQRFCLKK